ncbi:unnamed protein product [Closterium sp. Yama58-4]|nr:unnamed protein product [Closterium sp. Yama58-4]
MAPPEANLSTAAVAGGAGKKQGSEPVTPRTLFDGVQGPFGAEAVNELSARTSALKIHDLPEGGKNKDVTASEKQTTAPAVQHKGKEVAKENEEEDGYLSDDPDEAQDPEAINDIASQAGFAITLLIPAKWIEEVPRTMDTIRGLLLLWEEHLTENVKATTKCHKLTPAWLSKERFGRVQVVFVHATDANFMWSRKVEHVTVNNLRLTLGWQYPENQEYLKERSLKLDAIEVLLRNVPAVITPEMIRKSLVTVTLLKRKRTAFLEGSAFHRVVDPVTGSDTDKIKGLVYRHPGDKSSGTGSGRENQRLLDAWPGHDLKDAFRALNPGLREYTFHARPSGTKTRIDRTLVSTSLLGQLTAAEHVRVPPKLSDYRFAIHVCLKIESSQSSGPGIWRFQATRANRRGVREVISKVMRSPEGSSRTLESNLPRLSAALRAHEKEERKRATATKKHLVAEVTRLNHLVMAGPTDASTKERLLAKEAQLKGYEESERERMQVLAGMDLELHGEIPSPYLSAKVNIRKERTLIKEVVHKGERFYGSQEVLQAATAHFEEAFSEQEGTWRQERRAVEVAKRLPEEAMSRLSAPWTEAEIKEALVGLPRGKSPGGYGLPPELFKEHWDLLGASLVDFAKRFEQSANLEESITTAVTVLLHKKGPKDQLGNYRPITLLNTVYKVLAKLLANRLKKELHLVISEGQHGFIPGRCLADAVSVVADAVEAAGNGGEDWYLLMVDFQKAYDTIARPYLFETLRKLGIPEQFVRWTEGLYRGSGTTIAINGWVSTRVEMQRGVRQGCPLAPYLFMCALEPLCLEIGRKGLGVKPEGGTALTYIGYADDTTLILKGEDQLRSAAEILERFGDLSGIRTNKGKSVVVPLGRNRGKQSADGVDFKRAEDGVPERLLGIWISADGDGGPSWEKAWERGKGELVKWESHHLLTAARVTVINAYIMPIFIFQAQVYPPPEELWKRIQKTCDNYVSSGQATADKQFVLWSGELARLPKKEGGLGLVDPKARIDSLPLMVAFHLHTAYLSPSPCPRPCFPPIPFPASPCPFPASPCPIPCFPVSPSLLSPIPFPASPCPLPCFPRVPFPASPHPLPCFPMSPSLLPPTPFPASPHPLPCVPMSLSLIPPIPFPSSPHPLPLYSPIPFPASPCPRPCFPVSLSLLSPIPFPSSPHPLPLYSPIPFPASPCPRPCFPVSLSLLPPIPFPSSPHPLPCFPVSLSLLPPIPFPSSPHPLPCFPVSPSLLPPTPFHASPHRLPCVPMSLSLIPSIPFPSSPPSPSLIFPHPLPCFPMSPSLLPRVPFPASPHPLPFLPPSPSLLPRVPFPASPNPLPCFLMSPSLLPPCTCFPPSPSLLPHVPVPASPHALPCFPMSLSLLSPIPFHASPCPLPCFPRVSFPASPHPLPCFPLSPSLLPPIPFPASPHPLPLYSPIPFPASPCPRPCFPVSLSLLSPIPFPSSPHPLPLYSPIPFPASPCPRPCFPPRPSLLPIPLPAFPCPFPCIPPSPSLLPPIPLHASPHPLPCFPPCPLPCFPMSPSLLPFHRHCRHPSLLPSQLAHLTRPLTPLFSPPHSPAPQLLESRSTTGSALRRTPPRTATPVTKQQQPTSHFGRLCEIGRAAGRVAGQPLLETTFSLPCLHIPYADLRPIRPCI